MTHALPSDHVKVHASIYSTVQFNSEAKASSYRRKPIAIPSAAASSAASLAGRSVGLGVFEYITVYVDLGVKH
jgi:hypothetical protein